MITATRPLHRQQKPSATALALTVLLTLAGCEIREERPPQEPGLDPTAEPAPDTTPPETSEDAPVSIIRNEIIPVEPIDVPPPPVELVLPFPEGATLSGEAEALLRQAMQSEAMQEGWPVIVGGHTDSGGNDQANLRASRARAEAVAAWLVERGVADERITVIAFGEQNPAVPNARDDGSPDEAGRRTNRRVELRIAPPPQPETPAVAPTPAASTENEDA